MCIKTGERKFAKKTHSTNRPKKMPHCLIQNIFSSVQQQTIYKWKKDTEIELYDIPHLFYLFNTRITVECFEINFNDQKHTSLLQ